MITGIKHVGFGDDGAIEREIETFCGKYAYAELEHALVLSPDGHAYELAGTSTNVDIGLVGKEALRGSRVIHNHPPKGKDSFSIEDFIEYFDKGILQMDVVSGDLYNKMQYKGEPVSPSKAFRLYKEAYLSVLQDAKDSDTPVGIERLEIMRQLAKDIKGMIFSE